MCQRWANVERLALTHWSLYGPIRHELTRDGWYPLVLNLAPRGLPSVGSTERVDKAVGCAARCAPLARCRSRGHSISTADQIESNWIEFNKKLVFGYINADFCDQVGIFSVFRDLRYSIYWVQNSQCYFSNNPIEFLKSSRKEATFAMFLSKFYGFGLEWRKACGAF